MRVIIGIKRYTNVLFTSLRSTASEYRLTIIITLMMIYSFQSRWVAILLNPIITVPTETVHQSKAGVL